MQCSCLYKQITYFHRTINLKITKKITKLKEQKDTFRNLKLHFILLETPAET